MPQSFSLTRLPLRYRILRAIAVFSLVLACSVVIKGAYTRLVDAGLGCPDWPGCYGFLAVPQSAEAIELAEQRFPHAPVEADKGWPEMIHRYMAASLGLCIVVMAGLSLRRDTRVDFPRKHTLALLALVIIQGLFGMWTVTLKLWPQVVTLHLLGGFATTTLLALLVIRLYRPRSRASEAARSRMLALAHGSFREAPVHPARRYQWIPFALMAVLTIQIALGGWVSSNYAATACTGFPACNGEWFPVTDFAMGFDLTQEVGPNYLGGQLHHDARVAVHLAHRIGAAVTVGLSLAALFFLARRVDLSGLRPSLIVFAALLSLQVALGIINVSYGLPLAVATAHNFVALLLLLSAGWMALRLRWLTSSRTMEK